jgi:ribosome-associated heat shock protein Hsp15
MNKTLRIDKYLWCIRVYKTRSLATDKCRAGHVLANSNIVKPSYMVKKDDLIQIKASPIIRTYQVLDITERRVSAALVKDFVIETTSAEELLKLKTIANTFVSHDKGDGRPTKKNRRLIDKFKDGDI